MSIASQVEIIKSRIAGAAREAGRNPEDITLIGVTKTVSADRAREVMAAGVMDLGENRVQAFLDKYETLGNAPRWHLIGHLQTNKVKYIVGKVALIHSVDTLHVAEEISKKAVAEGITQQILMQFNISGEVSKSGATADEAKHLLESVSALHGLSVQGLMTMAPLGATETETRRLFADLRTLAESIDNEGFPNVSMTQLSMGMSGDFESAIREGATLVRIGSALFSHLES
ncbi:MAG: YggS family pyridoxal phosphate-dependent enzyme [Ruminococcaceae bacterium]|nr:YggS family pyridoxal phosphate-dependent enzyme [Oscillospiraceae bacterium]